MESSLKVPQVTVVANNVELEDSSPSTSCGIATNAIVYSGGSTREKDLLQSVGAHLKRIHDLLPEPYKSNIRTEDRKEIKDRVAQMFGAVHQMYGILSEMREQLKSQSTSPIQGPTFIQDNPHPTYADMARSTRKPSETTRTINKTIANSDRGGSSHALIVYPNPMEGERVDMKSITKEIMEKVKPQKLKVNVKAVRQVKGDGVCFRVGNRQEGETLQQAIKEIKEIEQNITCKVSEGRNPKLILINVPNSIETDHVLDIMYEQNQALERYKKDDYKANCKLTKINIRGKTNENCQHLVISVSPSLHSVLLNLKFVALSWAQIKVDDFLPLVRCYKCCGFQHLAKSCTKNQTCSHCTEEHTFQECSKDHKPKCINCINENKNLPNGRKLRTDHNAYSLQCPSAQIMSTNY
ncbi:uncharacterized protein [Centruroides vittatus]|uniref:uncharacterized protein n=1 Tax=Centruroides vittatus TaxID=120091 RepID=UPI00350F2A5C